MSNSSSSNTSSVTKAAEWRDEMRTIARGWLFSDLPDRELPPALILPLENPDLHDEAGFLARMSDIASYRCVKIGTYEGKRMGILSCKFGAPAVALVTEIVADLGTRRVIGVGYCGGLHANVSCGNIVIPTRVLRDDGTTPKYVAPNYASLGSEWLIDKARLLQSQVPAPLHFGPVWSTDAILMETTSRVSSYIEQGAFAVDMETGALYTIGAIRGLEVLSLLVASDHPGRQEHTDGKCLSEGHRAAIDMAFALAIA